MEFKLAMLAQNETILTFHTKQINGQFGLWL